MKVTNITPSMREYIDFEGGPLYIRYSGRSWAQLIDTPTGEIEQDVYDSDLEEQLEAAYQEYIRE